MAGVLPAETTMCDRLQSLGYVEVETISDSILGSGGRRVRGHQFRYSNAQIEPSDVNLIYSVSRRGEPRLQPKAMR